MISQKFSFQEKSYGGYIRTIILLVAAIPALGVFPIVSIIILFLAIASTVQQYKINSIVPVNNILLKYIQYLEEMHSGIPEKYHLAILNNLRNLHYSSFGKFEETTTFSPEELDQHINEFMEDADNNLKKYRSLTLGHAERDVMSND